MKGFQDVVHNDQVEGMGSEVAPFNCNDDELLDLCPLKDATSACSPVSEAVPKEKRTVIPGPAPSPAV
jgi:hypothetical protein